MDIKGISLKSADTKQSEMSVKTPTRKTTIYPIFETLAEMSQLKLLTNADIIQHYLFIRNEKKRHRGRQRSTGFKNSNRNCKHRSGYIWKKSVPTKDNMMSMVPTITFKKVTEIIKKLNTDYRTLLKPYKGKQQSESYTKKLKDLKLSWEETLFGITSYKCKDLNYCHCYKEKKIPAQEREFVIDQRTTTNLVIGSIDVAYSRKIVKRNQMKMERSQEPEKV
ncbi:unnamed protein product [Psylliodes chrysocephalus]|uniref:Uncharacterized protein n=1 Tax=Psylliodes chrysocephalus TaxID=3402493 RepID=A0A9P0D2A0_9CUCU|nr:unnamed protein product [Psylliodes chrysocephala]